MYKYFLLYLGIFLISCSNLSSNKENNENSNSLNNPLDSILGDKVEDSKSNKIRKNNFEKLKNITLNDLQKPSKLYDIDKKNKNYYVLTQKKNYSSARLFNIIFKIKNGRIQNYHIINDFSVKDYLVIDDNLITICDDRKNTNTFWESKRQINITKFDENFGVKWNYEIKVVDDFYYNLEASHIVTREQKTFYIVHLIIGCDMCHNAIELELDKNGKYKSAKEIDREHSKSLSKEKISKVFK